MTVDEDGALKKSTNATYLLAEKFNISLEATCGGASCLNRKNGSHDISIQNVFREALIDSNKQANKWCCATETSAEFYGFKTHSLMVL